MCTSTSTEGSGSGKYNFIIYLIDKTPREGERGPGNEKARQGEKRKIQRNNIEKIDRKEKRIERKKKESN